MTTTYPVYILDLNDEDVVVFPEDKVDISHSEFWKQTAAPLVAKHFSIPLTPLLNIPYCQRRARISTKGIVFFGENHTKALLRTICKATGETRLRWIFDEHEARLPLDVADFNNLISSR